MITMRDVANRANVSVSTVANVVNNRTSRMDAGILARVRTAISELDYHPNHIARSFKTGFTPLIGLLLPSISNPVYGTLAREIEAVAAERFGLHVLIGNSYREKTREKQFLIDLMGHGIRGVIVVSPSLEQPYYADYVARGLVVVSYDRRPVTEVDINVDYVFVDNFKSAFSAAGHLIEKGHTDLAYITPSFKTVARSDKINGFLAAAAAPAVKAAEVVSGQVSSYNEDEGMVQLGSELSRTVAEMAARPTGILAMNDLLAIGLLSGFRTLGLSVPDDFSIIGMDDLFLSKNLQPGLTTARAPFAEMAAIMVERIMSRLLSAETGTSQYCFETTLVIRGSVQNYKVGSKIQPATAGQADFVC